MDITQIDEQWLELTRVSNRKDVIVAISNTGKYKRADGTIGISSLRHRAWYDDRQKYCSQIIAEHFLITVRRPDQDFVDHITHHPPEYNVNNVLNLRWCTNAENRGFEESRENSSKATKGKNNPMYGRTGEKSPMFGITGKNHPNWKGDSICACQRYKRALKEYKSNPTQENLATLKEARLNRQEYQRHLRRAKKSRQ